MDEWEKLLWLESCDGVDIRSCLQSLSTNTCTYYTNIYFTITYLVMSSLKTPTSQNM